jgi:hypothetical protein
MIAPPGFFHFRWSLQPNNGLEDIAFVFKVPGGVDMAVLPDLLENVCQGPIVPTAIALVHISSDGSLIDAMGSAPVQSALLRFDGRLPLYVLSLNLETFAVRLIQTVGNRTESSKAIERLFSRTADWLDAGLKTLFNPQNVVVRAPAGYVFHKPSSRRSSFFIRADIALASSAATSFVALGILFRLFKSYGRIPDGLKVIFVDTMSVATTAFALRELLSHAGIKSMPQIESFHSYGGMEAVGSPLPGTSLCIISASSSMNLHREWIEQKRLSDRDAITLVTFDDSRDKAFALYAMPTESRPDEPNSSAKYDIRIAGENFFPVLEPPRNILLTKTNHSCRQYSDIFFQLRDNGVFGTFRASTSKPTRRSLFIDGEALLASEHLRSWVNTKLPHWLKAGTKQVIFQDDISSKVLAQHIAYIATQLGETIPKILSAKEVSRHTIDSDAATVCVALVVGRGNALLTLSRELRNCHRGPRLYVIGAQVSESAASLQNFDGNLKYSSHGATIDVLRMNTFLADDSIGESFREELSQIYFNGNARVDNHLPSCLHTRVKQLRAGWQDKPEPVLLPSGKNLDSVLALNEDFAFWPKGYTAGPYQAEVIGTMAAIFQNARTSKSMDVSQRLRSPMLMQVALDPENFARFNEGIIQASILRVALPSELDYRGDTDASGFMRVLMERIAARMGEPQQAELEFLTALVIGRLQLNAEDSLAVREAFTKACAHKSLPIFQAGRFLLAQFRDLNEQRAAF